MITCRGGALTSTIWKFSSHIVESTKKEDKLGKWYAIEINHDGKMIIVINLCRLSDGYGKGNRTWVSQHNRAIGKECTTRKHNEDFLEEMKEHAQGMKSMHRRKQNTKVLP